MGGRAAEKVFYGATTNGANGDLDMAKKIARRMIHDWGMGERLYYALATGRLLKREVRELFLDPLAEEGEPLLAYMRLSRRLSGVRIPKRI